MNEGKEMLEWPQENRLWCLEETRGLRGQFEVLLEERMVQSK